MTVWVLVGVHQVGNRAWGTDELRMFGDVFETKEAAEKVELGIRRNSNINLRTLMIEEREVIK